MTPTADSCCLPSVSSRCSRSYRKVQEGSVGPTFGTSCAALHPRVPPESPATGSPPRRNDATRAKRSGEWVVETRMSRNHPYRCNGPSPFFLLDLLVAYLIYAYCCKYSDLPATLLHGDLLSITVYPPLMLERAASARSSATSKESATQHRWPIFRPGKAVDFPYR